MSKSATAAAEKPAAASAADDTAASAVAAAPATARRAVPFRPLTSQIWPRENGVKFNTWEVAVDAGVPFEDLLRREYWANVSARMLPGSTVLAFARDGKWYAELIVWDAGQNWAHVSKRFYQERPEFEAAPGVDQQFVIERDPVDAYVVKRRDDGRTIKRNLPTHEDARRWIIEQQRVLRK